MKHKLLSILLCCVLLTGCGSAPVSSAVAEESQATEAPVVTETPIEAEPEVVGVPLKTDYVTEEMYERATAFLEGDLTRLAKAMRKAQAGEEITVATIGGSITEGYSSSTFGNCYATIFYSWWESCFPDTKVNYINAGIGGTPSYLGVHRVKQQVLDENPDVVIVEFSVNDGADNFYKKSYDNLVRKIMMSENEPAVLLLFTTQEDGTNAQENDSLIGFKYRLPMISYGNAVLPSIENDEFTWDDISPDNVHPNDMGHAIIGELLYTYLNDVYSRLDEISEEITPFDYTSLTKESYLNADMLGPDEITPAQLGSFKEARVNTYFTKSWHTATGEESIIFQNVEAANIGICFQRTTDGTYGQYDVYVDGEPVKTLDGDFKNGWGSAIESVEVYVSDEPALHTIEIKKNPDSTADLFTVLRLLIS
ncbi:MAG: SGNH/GDSL hydrolase family protein [Lachnospiraceae bacterium]|nr:SGNH/GDSL hydrolase family protein [Lachnospiraceae bacterium]